MNWSKLIFSFLLFTLFFSSCDESGKIIKEHISGADSAVINFYKGDGSVDSVVSVKFIRDKKQLEQLTAFISSEATEAAKCGYDGSIHFFKRDLVLQDIDFRMNDANCMHFSLLLGGKLYKTKLSPEAKQFLETLKK